MSAATVFQRLLWKEYRVLRQLWAMCGLGGTLIMLMILAIGEASTESRGYSVGFWLFMVWVPPVYVLAALATMFAGEREEGTLTWLTTLSPRLLSVLSSRLLFVAVTGIALQAWYGLVAIALSQFDDPYYVSGSSPQENLIIMSFLLVESLVYGLFWSLQTNRPLNAILYSAIMIVLVNSGAAMLIDFFGGRFSVIPDDALDYAFGFWGWVRGLLLVAVLAADWQLATRWLHGHPWDWEWVAQWWSRRGVKAATGTSTMVGAFPADASEPWRRAWQRLRWLEWQGIRSYAWIVLIIAVLSCLSILIRFERQPPTLGFCMIYCWMSLLIAGLMAWHGEQSQQRFRTLVRMGVAPFALWANKLVCWFAAAVCSTVVIAGTTLFVWSAISVVWPRQHYDSLTKIFHHMTTIPMWKEAAVVMGLTYAITFFVAFAAAHLFRRTVIAFGVALIGTSLAVAWMTMCLNFGLPAAVFVLPIPFWLLWISAGTLPAWWTERTSWWVTPPRAVVLVVQCLLPLVALAGAAGYRVWEVPTVPALDPSLQGIRSGSINASIAGSPQGTTGDWNRLTALLQQLPPAPPEVEKADRPFDDLALHFHAEALTHLGLSATEARETLVNTNRERLKEIRDQALNLHLLTIESARANQFRYLGYLPMLVYAAESALNAGETDDSLQYLLAAARLSGMVQRFTESTLNTPIQDPAIRDTLTEMVRWAQHPKQTKETIHYGLRLCAGELKYWQTQPEELYLLRNQEMDIADKAYWPWERARERKLVDVAYSNRLYYLIACSQNMLRPGYEATGIKLLPLRIGPNPVDAARQAWQFQPIEYARYSDERLLRVYGLENYRVPLMHEPENRYRATLALMAIVGHRRVHGSLPASLWDVEYFLHDSSAPESTASLALVFGTMSDPVTAMQDVWTGSHFGYAPTGFPLSAPEFPENCALRKPLIWTAESARYSVEIRQNMILRWTDSWGFHGHNVVRSTDDRESQSWIFPIPPQEEEPPKKE